MEPFQLVARRAAAHHGLVERAWLLAAGVAEGQLQRWLTQGRLERMQRGVYRLAGAPVTWEQRLLAAVLGAGPGAAASHRSAARLWEFHQAENLEITGPPARRRQLRGARLYRSCDIDEASVSLRQNIPVTNPLRTLVDLGAVVRPAELEDALDRALACRLVSVAGVETALDALARRGRPGAAALRTVLDERALGSDRPDSLLESRMAGLLRAHGLPPARFQYVVRDGGRFVARIDFAYPEVRVAIEVDGFDTHGGRRAFQSDRDRQNRLLELGWRVLRFTWADVVRHPDKVAAAILGVLRQSAFV